MKRFLFIASCAFLTAGLFSSCQKEEKSVLELARDLTTELQKVTDLKTADSIAPRVQVLNKRLQDATVRPFAASATSLQRSSEEDSEGQEGAALQDALKALAKEVGRVQASLPVATYDGDVDRDKLILAVGAANGAGDTAPASRRKSVGTTYMKGESNKEPGTFSEFYGSTKLAEALGYTAEPGSIGAFAMEEEPAPVPAAAPIAEEEEEAATGDEASADDAAAADSSAASDEEPAAADSESTDSADATPAAEDEDSSDSADAADSSSGDDLGLPSLDPDSGSSSSDDSSDDSSDSASDDSSDDEDFGIEI